MDSPTTSIDRKVGDEDHHFMDTVKENEIELDEQIQHRRPAMEILMREDDFDKNALN